MVVFRDGVACAWVSGASKFRVVQECTDVTEGRPGASLSKCPNKSNMATCVLDSIITQGKALVVTTLSTR